MESWFTRFLSLLAAPDSTIVAGIAGGVIGVVGALIGGYIGGRVAGRYAIKASNQQHEQSLTREKNARDSAVEGVVLAVAEEVASIWEAYNSNIGPDIRAVAPGGILVQTYSIGDTNFPLYQQNANLIGHIEDPELRQCIVRTYTHAASMVGVVQMNNRLLAERNEHAAQSPTQANLANMASSEAALRELATKLQQADAALSAKVVELEQNIRRVYRR